MTDELAEEISLDALVKLLVEVAANQAGGSADTVSIEGALDITNADHLEELEKLIEADLKGGIFGAELTAQGATVPFEVFEYSIEHSSDLINKVASEFDKLTAEDFGSIRAHGVSHLKHEAAEQILTLAKAVRSHFDTTGEVTSFSMQGFLALADAAEFNLALEEGYTLVRRHIIAINGYTDTDNDGLPDTCDAGCLATGLTADPDDDNDGVLDGSDIFPLNKDESVDTDGDGTGNNADTDDDNDGVADSDDAFPLNAKLSSLFKVNSVSVSDYVDQDRATVSYPAAISVTGGVLAAALAADVVIDRSNLKNLVDGNIATGIAPSLRLALDKVPSAGTTGTIDLTFALQENDDLNNTYQASERKIEAAVTVSWLSDGTNVQMSVPTGNTATLNYTHNGNSYALSRVNAAADVITFNQSDSFGNYPASIEIRALGFFAAAFSTDTRKSDFDGLNLGSFFDSASNYYVSVGVAQGTDLGNIFYQDSELVTQITANLKLGEVPGRFNLYRAGLLDFIDGDINQSVVYGLSPTVNTAGTLSLAMGTSNVVDLSNMESLVDSDASTGIAPRLLLVMDSVPASGESGSMDLTISMVDGSDATRSTGERSLVGNITANWSADAAGDISVTVPAQATLKMTYTSDNDTITVTDENATQDIIKLSSSKAFENFPATLEVRVLDWFNAALKSAPSKFVGLDLADFINAGDYFVTVELDQGTDEVLYYRRAENAGLLSKLEAKLTLAETPQVAGNADFGVAVDDWSTTTASPIELHVIYPIGAARKEIALYPAVTGKTMEFDFGPTGSIKKAHMNELLNNTNDGNELVPALQFKLADVANASGSFTLRMTVTSGSDGVFSAGDLKMQSEVDVTYSGDGTRADFTIPTQTQNVTVTDGSVCQTGCTFVLDAQQEILEVTSAGPNYPATLSAKLISIFDVNAIGRNAEATVELQTGDFHLLIEILPPSGGVAADVDDILTYGGLPITKVEGVIRID
jgi:hypothetical protein